MVAYLPKRIKKQRVGGKRWFLFLPLFFLVVLLGGLARTLQQSVWDGVGRLNIVLLGGEVELVSFNPPSAELTIFLVPGATQIETTRGYGIYRLEAIQTLEGLEKRQGLLLESLQENFAVPIDGWVKTEDRGQRIEDRKGRILGQLARQILGKKVTNLSRWDLLRLWWKIKGLRFDKVRVIDLRQTGALIGVALPDSTLVWQIDVGKLDSFIRDQKLFVEGEIRREKVSIEILNGTLHPGLADKGSRIISNLGGTVVWVGNSEKRSARCEVRSKEDTKRSYTVTKITKVFNCGWKEKIEEGKADITVILGEDYWQRLNQK